MKREKIRFHDVNHLYLRDGFESKELTTSELFLDNARVRVTKPAEFATIQRLGLAFVATAMLVQLFSIEKGLALWTLKQLWFDIDLVTGVHLLLNLVQRVAKLLF